MSFLSTHLGSSMMEIQTAENQAFDVLNALIDTINVYSERDAFYKDEIKKHFSTMKIKMNEEKKKLRREDYSLRHMVDIADAMRSINRVKKETNAIDLTESEHKQETLFSVMRFIANCHKSTSKWREYEIEVEFINKLYENLSQK